MKPLTDGDFMDLAISLAKKGLYSSTPNPRVGCVIVKNSKVIGQGWHERAGEDHAEIMALSKIEGMANGATVYTTLEPCCHVGRTGPCVDALITAKVARVVCAMADPNPLINGRGLRKLKRHGIQVTMDVRSEQAKMLNLGFVKRMKKSQPWIRLKIAAGLDGKTALENGVSKWITGVPARTDVHIWRAQSCAILTGIGTLDADDPQLSVRLVESDRQPLKIVVDSKLRISKDSRVLMDGRTLIVTATERDSKIKELCDMGAEVAIIPNDDGKVDLAELFKELGRRQINEVMVEAGNRLNSALMQERLPDELLIYYAPKILGDRGRGMFDLGKIEAMEKTVSFEDSQICKMGNDIRVRFLIARER